MSDTLEHESVGWAGEITRKGLFGSSRIVEIVNLSLRQLGQSFEGSGGGFAKGKAAIVKFSLTGDDPMSIALVVEGQLSWCDAMVAPKEWVNGRFMGGITRTQQTGQATSDGLWGTITGQWESDRSKGGMILHRRL